MGVTWKQILSTTCLTTLLVVVPGAHANPVGGEVVSGSATITENGNKLDILQSTDRAVIDWRSFDIAPDEHTQFYQPGSGSIALNRVNAMSPSVIAGKLSANGNVILVNPNGVFFSKTAAVDVNGLIATTADIDNTRFAQGSLNFDKPGNAGATISNEGSITAKEAGLIGLVAPNVVNSGVISAKLGRVHLASGDSVTVDLYGDGLLEVKASDALASQIVRNSGQINAEGGTIALSAAAGRASVNSVIHVAGELRAPSVGVRNGKIIIAAEGSNAVKGNITAEKGKKLGSSRVALSGATVNASGTGAGEKGGSITITGDDIALSNGSVLTASGAAGGGNILIGGDYKGQGVTATARTLIASADTIIRNDALENGNGGRTILWSDDATVFGGTITGRGGANGGSGGFVETSGHNTLNVSGARVDLRDAFGGAGTWLLDPTDITLTNRSTPGDLTNTFSAAQLEAMSAGANISLAATNNITFDFATDNAALANDFGITLTAGNDILSASAGSITTSGTGYITLEAGRDINLTHDVDLIASGTGSITLRANNSILYTASGDITTTGGAITLNSDRDASGQGRVNLGSGTALRSNGGNITIGGGLDPATTASRDAADSPEAVRLIGATIQASGGNISIRGNGGTRGITLDGNNSITTNGNGTLTLIGSSTSSLGIASYFGNTLLEVQNGDLTMTGTGAQDFGLLLGGGTSNIIRSTGSGKLLISGYGGTGVQGHGIQNGGMQITGTTGDITITAVKGANAASTNYLMTGANSFTGGAGTLTFNTTVNGAQNLTATAGAFVFNGAWGGTTALGNVSLTSANTSFTMPNLTSTGNVTLNAGTGTITTGSITTGTGNLTLTADDLVIGGNLSGTGTLTLQPSSTNRDVAISYGASNGTTFHLDTTEIGYLVNGWSGIMIGSTTAGNIMYFGGTTNWLDPVTFKSRSNIGMWGNIAGTDNASFTFLSNGYTEQRGNVTLANGNYSVTAGGSYFALSGNTNTGGGSISLGNILAHAGSLTTMNFNSGGGAITVGTIGSTAGNPAGKTFIFDAAAGTMNFGGAANTTANITAGAGSITFNGAWGGTTPLGNVSLTSANTSFTMPNLTSTGNVMLNAGTGTLTTNAISTGAGNLTLRGDEIDLLGSLSGTGNMKLYGGSLTQQIEIGSSNAASLNLTAAELANIQNGWTSIMIGDGGYNANIYTSEAVSFSDHTTLTTSGNNLVHVNSNITTTDGANLTLNGGNGDDLRWGGNEAVVVDGNLTVAGNLYLTGWRATFVLGDMNVTGDVIHSSGGLTGSGNFAIGGNFTAGNINTLSAASGTVAGNFTSTQAGNRERTIGGNIAVGGNVTISNADTVGGGNGNSLLLTGTLSAGGDMSLTATDNPTSSGQYSSIYLGPSSRISANGNISLTSDAIVLASGAQLSGNGNGSSTLTIREYGDNGAMTIGGTAVSNNAYGHNKWQLASTDIAAIQDGFASITFGNAAQSANINITANLTFTDPVSFITNGTAAVTTVADTTINSTNNNLTFTAPITAAGNLTLTAGTGTITTGAIATGAGNLTLTADDMVLGGNLSGTGTVTLQQSSAGRALCVNYTGTGCTGARLALDATEQGYLADGWSQIRIGNSTNGGTIYLGATSWRDSLRTLTGSGGTATNILGAVEALGAGTNLQFTSTNLETGSSITTNGGFAAVSGNLRVNDTSSITTNGGAFSLTSGQLFQTDVGAGLTITTANGNISINQIGTNAGLGTGKLISLNAGTGTIAFNNTVNTAANITATGGAFTFNGAWGGTTPLGNVSLTSANTSFTMPNLTSTGNVSLTAGTGTITTGTIATGAGNLTLTADDLVIGGNLSGTGTVTLQPYSSAQTICVNYSTGACAGSSFSLSTPEIGYLSNGWSAIRIGSLTTGGGGLYIGSSDWLDPVYFTNTNAHSGNINIYGPVNASGDSSVTVHGRAVNVYGTITTAGRDVSLTNSLYQTSAYSGAINTNGGNITIDALAHVGGGGDLSLDSAGGNISIGNIGVAGGTSGVGKNFTFNAGAGNIAISGTVNTGGNITANAGSISLGGAWGGTNALGNVSLTSANTSFTMPNLTSTGNVSLSAGTGTITTGTIATGAGNLTLTSDDITIGGNLSGTGVLTLQTHSTSGRTMRFNYGTGGYDVSTAELSYLSDGWSRILLGRSDAGSVIQFGDTTWKDPVQVRRLSWIYGTMTGTGDASFQFDGAADLIALTGGVTTSGGAIAFQSSVLLNGGGSATSWNLNSGGGNITISGTLGGNNSASGKTLNINAGAGAVSFGSTVNSSSTSYPYHLTAAAGSYIFGGIWGGTGALGNVSLTSANTSFTMPNLTSTGSVSLTAGTGTITTGTIATGAGNLTLTADDLVIGGNLSGTGTVTLQPSSIGRPVRLNSGADDGTSLRLSTQEIGYLVNGWNQINIGNVDSTQPIAFGATNWVDPVSFRTKGALLVYGALTGTDNASFDLSTTSYVDQRASISTQGQFIRALTTSAYTIHNSSITSGGGVITLNNYRFGSGVPAIASGGGNIQFTGTVNNDAGSGLGSTKTLSVDAGSGPLAFGGTVNGGASITASAGNFTFNGDWGGSTAMGNVSLTSTNTSFTMPNLTSTGNVTLNAGTGTITTGGITTGAGNLSITADDVVLGGNLSGTGTLTLQPTTPGQALNLNGLAGGFNLDATELTRLVDGWSGITIGRSNATGLATLGAATFYDPLTLRAGSINVTGNFQPTALGNVYAYTGDINFNAPVNYAAPSGTLTYYSYGDINVNQTYSQTQGGGYPRLAFRANLGPTGNININADVYAREGFDFIARNDINVNARLTSGASAVGTLWAANGDVNGTGWLTIGASGSLSSGTPGYNFRSGLKAGARQDITFNNTQFLLTNNGNGNGGAASILGFKDITINRGMNLGGGAVDFNAYGRFILNSNITEDHGDTISITAANGIYLNANITRLASTSGGRQFNFNSDVILGNDVTIDAHSSAIATITFGGTINGDGVSPRSLTLLASGGTATFNGAVGNTVPLGALNVTAASTVVKNNITTNNANITMNGPVTITGGPSIWNAGTATITTGSTVSAGANNLTLTADDLVLGGNLSGTGTLALLAYSDNRAVCINSSAGSCAANNLNLNSTEIGYLADGWSQIDIGRSGTNRAALYIGSSNWSDPIRFLSGSTGAQILLGSTIAGTGNAAFSFLQGGGNTLNNLASSITTQGGAITFGIVSSGDASAFTATSNGGTITIERLDTGAVGKLMTFDAGSGIINFNGPMRGGYRIVANAASYLFGGSHWGYTSDNVTPNALTSVSLTSNNTSFTMPNLLTTGNVSLNAGTGTITTGAIATGAGNLTLTADDLAIGGNLSGTGTLTLQPYSIARVSRINYGAGDFNLDTTELGYLVNGWGQIIIGRDNGATNGAMYIGQSTWRDRVTFYNGAGFDVYGTLTGTENTPMVFSSSWGNARLDLHGNTIDTVGDVQVDSGQIGFGNIYSSAGSIYFNKSAVNLQLNATANAGTVRFNSGVRNGNINVSADTIIINGLLGHSGMSMGSVSLTARNSITLPQTLISGANALNVTVTGAGNAITTTGTITTDSGNVTLTADDLIIGGNLSGTGVLTLQPSTASRVMCVNYASGSCASANLGLSTAEIASIQNGGTSGWSQIILGPASGTGNIYVGASNWYNPLALRNYYPTIVGALTSSAPVTLNGTLNTLADGGSITTTNQAVSLLSGFTTYLYGNSAISTGGGAITTNNLLTVYSGGTLTSQFNSGGGNITIGGTISDFYAATSINALNLNAGSGTLAFGNTVNTRANLTASAGNLTFNGAWGGTTPLGNVSLTSANTSFTMPNLTSTGNVSLNAGTGTITTGTIATGAGNLTLTANDLAIGGNLSGTGTLTVTTPNNNRALRINTGNDDNTSLYLSTAEIARFVAGWSSISITNPDTHTTASGIWIGQSDWTSPVSFFSNSYGITVNGPVTSTQNLTFGIGRGNAGLSLASSITTSGNITFNTALGGSGGTLQSTGGNIQLNGNGSSSISNFGTINLIAQGNIGFSKAVQFGTTLNAQSNSMTFGANWDPAIISGNPYPVHNVSLTSTNSLTLPSITATSIFARTTGATSDITLASGKVLTVSGGGDALTLVAGRNFINNAGAGAFNMTGAGRWLVYSTNPTDTVGEESLSSSFRRYSCSYASVGSCSGGAVSIPAGGNGLIYSYTPMLTATPDTLAALTYGDAAPNLNGYGYTLSGYLAGDTGDNVTGTLIGGTNYTQGADIGTYGIGYISGTLASAMGYGFTYAPNANAITVNARTISATLNGITRQYDTTATAALSAGNFTLSNVYGSDDVGIANITGAYDNQNAGTGKTVSVSGLTLSGAKAGNYLLASNTASGAVGTITKGLITATASSHSITAGETVPTSTISYSGFAGSEDISVLDVLPSLLSVRSGIVTQAGTYSGNYALSGGADNNYDFAYINGTLTVIGSIPVIPSSVTYISQRPVETKSNYAPLQFAPAAQIVIQENSTSSDDAQQDETQTNDARPERYSAGNGIENDMLIEISPELARFLSLTPDDFAQRI